MLITFVQYDHFGEISLTGFTYTNENETRPVNLTLNLFTKAVLHPQDNSFDVDNRLTSK